MEGADTQEYLNVKLLEEVSKPTYMTDITKVEDLLSRRADANCRDTEGNSPLQIASKIGNYPVVKILLTEVEKSKVKGLCTHLFETIAMGLRRLADRQETGEKDAKELDDDQRPTSSWWRGFYCTALRSPPDIDPEDARTQSERLVEKIETSDLETSPGLNDLVGYYRMLQRKANITFESGVPTPNLVEQSVEPEMFLQLLQRSFKNTRLMLDSEGINARSHDGDTALHKAAGHGHLAVVKLLMRYGANTAIVNREGWTPVMAAVAGSHAHVFYYFAECAEALRPPYKKTFQLACRSSILPIIKYIYNVSGEFQKSSTSLHALKDDNLALQAYLSGRKDTLNFLAKQGVDVFPLDGKGKQKPKKMLDKGDLILADNNEPAVVLRMLKHVAPVRLNSGLTRNVPQRTFKHGKIWLIRYFYPKYITPPKGGIVPMILEKDTVTFANKTYKDSRSIRVILTPKRQIRKEDNARVKEFKTRMEILGLGKNFEATSGSSEKQRPNSLLYDLYELSPYEEVRWDIGTDNLLPLEWSSRFMKDDTKKLPIQDGAALNSQAEKAEDEPISRPGTGTERTNTSIIRFGDSQIQVRRRRSMALRKIEDKQLAHMDQKNRQKWEHSESLGLLPPPPSFSPCVNYIDFPSWTFPYRDMASHFKVLPGPSIDKLPKHRNLKGKKKKHAKLPILRQIYVHKETDVEVSPGPYAQADVLYDDDGNPLFYHVEIEDQGLNKMEKRRGWVMSPSHLIVTRDAKGDVVSKRQCPSWKLVQKGGETEDGDYLGDKYMITHPNVLMYMDYTVLVESVDGGGRRKQKEVFPPTLIKDNLLQGIVKAIPTGEICIVTNSTRHPVEILVGQDHDTGISRHDLVDLNLILTKDKGWVVGNHLGMFEDFDIPRIRKESTADLEAKNQVSLRRGFSSLSMAGSNLDLNVDARLEEVKGMDIPDEHMMEGLNIWHPSWRKGPINIQEAAPGITDQTTVGELLKLIKDTCASEKKALCARKKSFKENLKMNETLRKTITKEKFEEFIYRELPSVSWALAKDITPSCSSYLSSSPTFAPEHRHQQHHQRRRLPQKLQVLYNKNATLADYLVNGDCTLYIIEASQRYTWHSRSVFDVDEDEAREMTDRGLNSVELRRAWDMGILEAEKKHRLDARKAARAGSRGRNTQKSTPLTEEDLKKAVRSHLNKEIRFYEMMGIVEAKEELQTFMGGWDLAAVRKDDRDFLRYGLTSWQAAEAAYKAIPDKGERTESWKAGRKVSKKKLELINIWDTMLLDKKQKESRRHKGVKQEQARFEAPDPVYLFDAKHVILEKLYACSTAIIELDEDNPDYILAAGRFPFVFELKRQFPVRWYQIHNRLREELMKQVSEPDTNEKRHSYYQKGTGAKPPKRRLRRMHVYDEIRRGGMRLIKKENHLLASKEAKEKHNDELRKTRQAMLEKAKVHMFFRPRTEEFYTQMQEAKQTEATFEIHIGLRQAQGETDHKGMKKITKKELEAMDPAEKIKLMRRMEAAQAAEERRIERTAKARKIRRMLMYRTYQDRFFQKSADGRPMVDNSMEERACQVVRVAIRALRLYEAVYRVYNAIEGADGFVRIYERFKDPTAWFRKTLGSESELLTEAYQEMMIAKMFVAFGRRHHQLGL